MLNKIARGPTIKSNMVGNENGKPWRMSSSLKLKGVHFKNFSPFVFYSCKQKSFNQQQNSFLNLNLTYSGLSGNLNLQI